MVPSDFLVVKCLFLSACMVFGISGSLVRLVSKCTTNSGIGRCAALPSSCMDMGGTVEDEIQLTTGGTKPLNYCPDDEVCCMLSPIPFTETCQICGKKGVDRTARRTNLERNLDASTRSPHKLRVLRDVSSKVKQDMSSKSAKKLPSKMGRIMNGDNAEKNEWCWQVALLNTDGSILGSGSLIDGRFVVTAAHKIIGKNASNLVILVGQYDFGIPITSDSNESTVWYAKPLEITIHEGYDPNTLDNNIAIIRIPMVSCNTANVCPVCLNSVNEQVDYMATFSNCYITGWGAAVARESSTILQEARVRILSANTCQQRFSALGLLDVQLPPSAFCAEGLETNTPIPATGNNKVMTTCGGDGGGPLVCEFPDGIWRLMGLIAMGLDDCKHASVASPTVFVNVGMYIDWIHNVRRRASAGEMGFPPAGSAVEFNQIANVEANRMPKSVDAAKTTTKPPTQRDTYSRSVFGRSL